MEKISVCMAMILIASYCKGRALAATVIRSYASTLTLAENVNSFFAASPISDNTWILTRSISASSHTLPEPTAHVHLQNPASSYCMGIQEIQIRI